MRNTRQAWDEILDIAVTAAYLVTDDSPGFGWQQSICSGLLQHMTELMASMNKLASGETEHGEAILILSRSVFESAITLRYLLLKNSDEVYAQFVRSDHNRNVVVPKSLLNKDIHNQGGKSTILQRRMVSRLEQYDGEMPVDRNGPQMPGLLEQINDLGLDESSYRISYNGLCWTSHGMWPHLIGSHVKFDGQRYVPHHRPQVGGLQSAMPAIGIMTAAAANAYLTIWFADYPKETEPLRKRLAELWGLIMADELANNDWQMEDRSEHHS